MKEESFMKKHNPKYKHKNAVRNTKRALRCVRLRKNEGWKCLWEIYKKGTIHLELSDLKKLGKIVANIYRRMKLKYPKEYFPIAHMYIIFNPGKEKKSQGLVNYYPPHFHQTIKDCIKMYKKTFKDGKKEKTHS